MCVCVVGVLLVMVLVCAFVLYWQLDRRRKDVPPYSPAKSASDALSVDRDPFGSFALSVLHTGGVIM